MNSFKQNLKQELKYCKVCHDMGKPETEYRSHFTRETRDPSSKVTCPTLNAMECRYCYKKGHTVKYCQILKDNEKMKKQSTSQKQVHVKIPSVNRKPETSKKVTNMFTCLDEDEDEDEEAVKEVVKEVIKEVGAVKEEFPALSGATARATTATVTRFNYAGALEKSGPRFTHIEEFVPKKAEVMVPLFTKTQKASEMNWAAMDSDSDEDNESDWGEPANNNDTFDDDEDW